MSTKPPVARSLDALHQQVALWHDLGLRIGLVPTMGALHRGHLSLVAKCRQHADRTIASIFINPRQFGPGEDIERYPRQEAGDFAALAEADCDLVYAPAVEVMYPPGFATLIRVAGMDDLCGLSRPGHFDGVATVVTKLVVQTQADIAVFGEKDFQQLTMIRRLVRDLDLNVEIISAPLVRDADGLALSSRNSYLSAGQRQAAIALPNALLALRQALLAGADIARSIEDAQKHILAAGFASVDYVALRYESDLSLPRGPRLIAGERPLRLLAAAYMGTTRLIDTIAVAPG